LRVDWQVRAIQISDDGHAHALDRAHALTHVIFALFLAHTATGAGGGLPPSALGELQELRSLLLQAQAERDALIAERDAALRATKAAEGEIAKLNYRVMHLMRAVR
jgi:hypothetical protein